MVSYIGISVQPPKGLAVFDRLLYGIGQNFYGIFLEPGIRTAAPSAARSGIV
jgi:hypothetical protein